MEPFATLIHTHGAHVWRVCRALVSPDDADDAWQETFLAALRSYPQAAPANPRAWLVGIAHHKCADIHRRRYRDPIPVKIDGHRLPETSSKRVDDGDLWSVVAGLPPKQRQVIAYRYLGGLAYKEIAHIVGGNAAAARRAAADGLRNLRELLKDAS